MTYEADPAALEMLTRGEEWRPVADWEGLYEVSSFGRVKSLERVVKRATSRPYVKPERLLRPATKSDGHPFVGLHERERRRVRTVHILVARSFLGEPPPGTEVCHNDGDSRNNFIYNLRYDTRLANVADMFKHGRNHDAGRTNCKRGHPAMSACRACNRARWLLHQLGKKYGVRTDEAGFHGSELAACRGACVVSRLGDRALGATLAVGAWAFAIATYPAALAYAYAIREAAAAFDASLEELTESWESRQDSRLERAS